MIATLRHLVRCRAENCAECDSGMSDVHQYAGDAIRKDVIAIRSDENAAMARGMVNKLLGQAPVRIRRSAYRAPEQPRPSGRLQPMRHFRSTNGAGKPSAES